MDHIYPTKDYKVYKIKDEVDKLSQNVLSSEMPLGFDDIPSVAGVSAERFKQISLDICSVYEDYGDVEPSHDAFPFSAFPKDALELNYVRTLKEGGLTFKEPRVKDNNMRDKSEEKTDESSNADADMEIFKDSVITVRFYEPFQYVPSMKNQPRFHQEYEVLGSNFLTDLRDKFYCQCNFGPFFDISVDPQKPPVHDPDAPDPGFFFIHDTFYNDTRNTLNHDYSEVILQWFKRFHYVHEYQTGVMQDTKFEDLRIRIGYPCVYQHYGACEHIFCITSVDLLDNSNSLVRSDYPKLSNTSRKRSTLCDLCAQADASFLVTNCALHVKDPMRVCDSCFFSFHYASDGATKTCDFSAYRIFSVRPEK